MTFARDANNPSPAAQPGARERGIFCGRSLPAAMAAGVALAVFPRLGRLAPDQLVEIALLSARRFLLMQQGEAGLVKFLKELLPGDFFERVILGMRRAGKFDSDDAWIVLGLGRAHRRRSSAARLCPFANLVVIGGDFCVGHA